MGKLCLGLIEPDTVPEDRLGSAGRGNDCRTRLPMNSAALTLILIAASPVAVAADFGTWRDLNVQVESLAEPILVNGLPMKSASHGK